MRGLGKGLGSGSDLVEYLVRVRVRIRVRIRVRVSARLRVSVRLRLGPRRGPGQRPRAAPQAGRWRGAAAGREPRLAAAAAAAATRHSLRIARRRPQAFPWSAPGGRTADARKADGSRAAGVACGSLARADRCTPRSRCPPSQPAQQHRSCHALERRARRCACTEPNRMCLRRWAAGGTRRIRWSVRSIYSTLDQIRWRWTVRGRRAPLPWLRRRRSPGQPKREPCTSPRPCARECQGRARADTIRETKRVRG